MRAGAMLAEDDMKISVKTSLLAMVGVLIAAILVQGSVALVKMRHMRAATVDISDNWLPSVKVLGEVKYAATRLRVQEGRHILNTDPAEMKVLEERMGKSRDAIETLFTKYEPLIASEEEQIGRAHV